MVEGTQRALEILEELTECTGKNSSNQEPESLVKSPLIDLAKTEYNLQTKRFQQALKALQQFQFLTKETQDQSSSTLTNFLKSLKDNYTQMYPTQKNKNHFTNENSSNSDPSINLVEGFRNQINRITEAYMMLQNSANQGNQLDPSEQAIRYGEFYIQYDEIKQKILSILSNQLKVESQNIFKVKTTKKGQVVSGQEKKVKKPISKEMFFQESKPATGSLEKKKPTKAMDNNLLPSIQKPKESDIPQNQLQEMQILLVQVNRFIGFFKNRLKNYSVSRIKEFSPSKIRQGEISAVK